MKILSLDTSAKTATVALTDDERIIAEYSLETETHSSVILPMIENILEMNGTAYSDVDMYAVSVGPGSFTGIRIGVSTVKGLAFKNNTPCVGASALEAMAMNFAGVVGTVVPIIDARRGLVYTALFKSDSGGQITRITDDAQISIEELFSILGTVDDRIYFTGDAYEKVTSRDDKPVNTAVTPHKLRRQSAAGVALAALRKWSAADDKSAFTDVSLMPVYLKKAQAEREREEMLAKQKQ